MTSEKLLTRRDNAVEGHLRHDQEDQKSDTSPYQALLEGRLGLGHGDLGDQGGEWLHQVKESDCRVCVSTFRSHAEHLVQEQTHVHSC
jgi:hypothetical protein